MQTGQHLQELRNTALRQCSGGVAEKGKPPRLLSFGAYSEQARKRKRRKRCAAGDLPTVCPAPRDPAASLCECFARTEPSAFRVQLGLHVVSRHWSTVKNLSERHEACSTQRGLKSCRLAGSQTCDCSAFLHRYVDQLLEAAQIVRELCVDEPETLMLLPTAVTDWHITSWIQHFEAAYESILKDAMKGICWRPRRPLVSAATSQHLEANHRVAPCLSASILRSALREKCVMVQRQFHGNCLRVVTMRLLGRSFHFLQNQCRSDEVAFGDVVAYVGLLNV
eukprot:Polyplicarium_translucidae@DN2725_c0_g1_i22.p1